ncbi:alanine racemase [Schaalia sp. ZJ405]|uniref:alanine racemase n=1 Tax=Schaalia sp. ZJ405 TaxID=2709403 RepID=UPI001E346157|nr:alanine racemase [Schaalia sp. ZJ405]
MTQQRDDYASATFDPKGYPSRAHVDLDAIEANLQVLRRAAPSAKQLAVVKADAYGHGLLPVALAALHSGADWLGVAQLTEALELRRGLDEAGIRRQDAPILAWIARPGDQWQAAIAADIDLSVSWTWALAEICQAVRALRERDEDDASPMNSAQIKARIHVKIDTGMSRAGSTLADVPALASAVRMAQDAGLVDVVGAWSHLSRADDPSDEGNASTARHVEIFEQGLEILAQAGVRPQIRHLAATSGILWHPETHYDMVRAGIGVYGLSPDPSVATSAELGLRPAMTLSAPLTSVKVTEDEAPASYGGTWRAHGRRWLGLVPIGYADGVLRAASNTGPVTVISLNGPIRTHIVGRVCMDQFIVDLGPADGEEGLPSVRSGQMPARVGDLAVLFGDSTADPLIPHADEWADLTGTISYEVVSRLGERVPRTYSGAIADRLDQGRDMPRDDGAIDVMDRMSERKS